MDRVTPYNIVLASKSPRRQYLLRELKLPFTVRTKDTDESFASGLKAEEIPLYLCRKKADALASSLQKNELLITADTIVWINGQVLNKPADADDAFRMLQMLSGNMHEVFTGVCLMSRERTKTFFVCTRVFFRRSTDEQIRSYIRACAPFDKAGAYGAQECLPAGMLPCSDEEIAFLAKHHALHLNAAEDTPGKKKNTGVLVERLEGSYFNVMGLPLVELYGELAGF